MKIRTGEQAMKLRMTLDMNQKEFWSRVGSSQSGGSRFEKGRKLPVPIQILLSMAYSEHREATQILSALRSTK